ncbi:gliding motility-associated C-terminal domain-containing protein [Flavobacterium sp. xlx-214]|uniref:T9SS type B sorting domain-containing protein n=1 Tax=unclassified Flavobacterium TaxID=196869 RepID=UPI0013D5C4F7|nr:MULTISPECIES: gliding motility-associated C-terminal domain-containing protein [unclassified Flavobacterium]MBA5794050.1 gliding motility-associated C-terminal domain-containing protein [Flavobacterium sp. xlx-221]QMI83676.1 gliding motility-associated C-terminal domain-containing protein [Flavobacterium sp. xlx-214]
MYKKTLLIFFAFISTFAFAQKVSLFKQFYGSYDFTMLGNTMNVLPNGDPASCAILTESSDFLRINGDKTIVAAYLYWSGNGVEKEADLNVKLNGVEVKSTKENYLYLSTDKKSGYFSAFADVTNIVKQFGKGEYKLSELDLTRHMPKYCGGNYVGWSIAVVYQDPQIENNLVAIYDGFEIMDRDVNPMINIVLDGFRITNAANSKIAFLAWEGDKDISDGEELRINDKLLSNGLNPSNNAFNGTNTFSGSIEAWNMDLDLYDLSNHVKADDTSLDIKMKTNGDVVLINTIVLSVYSVFPDATIAFDSYKNHCHQRIVDVEYTVANYKGNHPLKSNTPIAFYINNELVGKAETDFEIGIGKESKLKTRLEIPAKFGYRFDLMINVDDDGTKKGFVYEIDEENNSTKSHVNLAKDCPIQKGVSANSDGSNDGFDLSIYDLNELKIYNRYGTEVFKHGKGYTTQWIGQDKNGQLLPAGTYYYVFSTAFETFSGYIYLIREIK